VQLYRHVSRPRPQRPVPAACEEETWREIKLTGNQTLASLGWAIPFAFDFDDYHLWSFFRKPGAGSRRR